MNSSWACTEHCIFICIDCAHTLKSQCGDVMLIKSLSMASWSSEEIAKLGHGGNLRLKSLMMQFGVPKELSAHQRYTCKAVEYYRNLIKSELYNVPAPQAPRLDEGIDLKQLTQNSWWGRARDSITGWASFGKDKIVEGVGSGLKMETVERIKNTGVNAICGLREITCTMAESAFSKTTEDVQPDYVKMVESPDKDNNR